MADLIQALEAKTDPRMRKVEVRCNISAPLSHETPLVAIDFSLSAEMVERVDVSAGRGIYVYNGTLQFDDQNLQQLYESARLDFRGDIDKSSSNVRFRTKTLGLMFDLGPLSDVELNADKASFLSAAKLENACRQRARGLGEPFTCYFGTGLDRLTAVSAAD